MVEHENADAGAPLGLRERRRRETLREVADAALELFERQGVAATTVDEIAQAAGIAPRTFFRYFATKEHAVFVDDEDFSAVMRDTLVTIRAGAPLAEALESGWLRLLAEFDARPDEHAHALRVRRLVHSEPTLLARALANDAEHIDELTDAAVDAAGASADVLTSRAVVALVATFVRLAFDEWIRRAELGTASSVRDIYLELRRGVGDLGAALPGGRG